MKPFEGDTHIPQEILKLKERFGIKSVLETGSQYGFTQKWFKENFETVYGCEINVDFYNYCVEQKLGVLNSTSVYAIQNIEFINLYYLDAHGFGFKCPLKDELKEIAEKRCQPVICIHDFFVPGKDFGYDEYEYKLCFEEIEPLLPAIYPDGYEYHYNTEANGAKRGIIYIYPKK
jgi:hypothetical protein